MAAESPVPTSSVRSAAEEAILWAAVKDAAAKRYEEARARALAEMEDAGVVKMVVRAADDRTQELGSLGTAVGKWLVDLDEDELLAWVQDHRPGEWYQSAPQLHIRPSFVQWCEEQAILRARAGHDPRPLDEHGHPIPGVRAYWKPGATTVTANREAKGRAAAFIEALFTRARGLPAPANGETDEPGDDRPPWDDEPRAVPAQPGADPGDRADGTGDVLAELRRRVAYAASLPGAVDPDHPGGAGAGAAERPEPARPVVPGSDRGGDDRPDVPAAKLAGGLLGAVAANYAHPLAHPDALTVADIDAYAEPHEPEPVRVTDTDEPAPF